MTHAFPPEPVSVPAARSGRRAIAALGGLLVAALAVVLVRLSVQGPGVSTDSRDLLAARSGSTWFRVDLGGQHAGWARLSADPERLEMGTELRFRLPGDQRGRWQRVQETLRFGSAPPHHLETLQVHRTQGPFEEQVQLSREGIRYRADVLQRGEPRTHWLDLDYTLADHLALEHWLAAGATGPGITTTPLDSAGLQRQPQDWTLAGRPDGGWLLQGGARGGTLLLGADLRPRAMTLGSGLALHATDRASAMAVPTAPLGDRLGGTHQLAGARAGLDQPLGEARQVTRLELALNAAASGAFGDAPGQRRPGPSRLLVDRSLPDPEPSAAELQAALAETPAYPLRNAQISRLAAKVRSDHALPGPRIRVLTALVHHSLTYDTRVNPLSVTDTLALRRGDCTEFAELFTTLARASGLPTRTVTGLAYLGDDARAFGVHAWNEVWTGERWQVVDPTWNQPEADATHLRFSPQADPFAVAAMAFEVTGVERAAPGEIDRGLQPGRADSAG